MTTARPRRLRVGVVGLAHYHVTGWVETLEGFPDELEIVALYDPDPERGRTLAPLHHDPSLRPALGDRYRGIPFETRLDDLIDRHDLDLALVTLPNADAPAAIARLAAAGIHLLVDKPAARSAGELRRCGGGRRGLGRPIRGGADPALCAGRSGGASRRRRGSARAAGRGGGGLRDLVGRGAGPGQPPVRPGGQRRRDPELARHPRHRRAAVAVGRADRRGRGDDRQRRPRRASRSRTSRRWRCGSRAARSARSGTPTPCRHAATAATWRCAGSTPRSSSVSTTISSLLTRGADGALDESRQDFSEATGRRLWRRRPGCRRRPAGRDRRGSRDRGADRDPRPRARGHRRRIRGCADRPVT